MGRQSPIPTAGKPYLVGMPRIAALRIFGFACAFMLAWGALSGQALGEVGVPAGTTQQGAADALFLQYAPALAKPGIICLVDSGVDANPDTTPILAGSYALSPNTNTNDELAALNPPLPGGHPAGHGTYMAMIAAAPENGWGMVGLAPSSVRVYNLKALAAGQTTFAFSEYAAAISRCQALSSSMPITVVNLSLGSSTQPSASEVETLENYVQSANAHGLSVVAAVGNESGPVQAPANVQGVLGVGASDANPVNRGGLCPFSNRGLGLAVLAPGCSSQAGGPEGIEVAFSDDGSPAWAYGTSESGEVVSTVEASMRAYAPTLSYSQAQGCITSTLTNGSNLDVAAAFNACGLGAIVSQGMAAYQATNAAAPPAQPSGPPAATLTPVSRPARPKIIKITFRHHRLIVTVAAVPKGLRLKLVVQAHNHRGRLITLAHTTTAHTRSTLRVGRWDRIVARFLQGHVELPVVIANHVPPVKHASLGKSPAR
jgi:hypothetical protein